jgi:hypothetical protein
MRRSLVALSLALTLIPQAAQAIPISTFLQISEKEQRAYVAGAVSMLAFSELAADRSARTNCITGWYRGKGEDQIFAGLKLDPAAFKARFGVDRDGNNGHVELVMLRLANEACPK